MRLSARIKSLLTVTVAAIATAAWFAGVREPDAPAPANNFSPFQILAALADEDFNRVASSPQFNFPADHAAHGEYRTEWWHITGTVEGPGERPVGVQYLIVRIGLAPGTPEQPSRWTASALYAGLLSVTDPFNGRLLTGQRLSRAALGLAGTTLDPPRIWTENWHIQATPAGGGAADWALKAATEAFSLELSLENTHALIESSRLTESSTANPPFQFYIQPHLTANGRLRIGDHETPANGNFAIEHAWGELPLPGGPVARDRFTLHLEDGHVLIALRTHRTDGTGSPETTGLLYGPDGDAEPLSDADIQLEPTDYWTSSRTGIRFPIRWMLQVPALGIEAELMPYWEDQEGSGWISFWAGPVTLQAPSSGSLGRGFMILNGY